MNLAVDASVAVKWFVREDRNAAAEALLAQADGLAAPDLILVETTNVLWRKHRLGQVVSGQVHGAAEQLAGGALDLVPSAVLLRRAAAIALDLDHPVYDCMYLACAELRAVPFVTADERLFRRVQGTMFQPVVRHLSGASWH